MAEAVQVRCFTLDPSIKSSLRNFCAKHRGPAKESRATVFAAPPVVYPPHEIACVRERAEFKQFHPFQHRESQLQAFHRLSRVLQRTFLLSDTGRAVPRFGNFGHRILLAEFRLGHRDRLCRSTFRGTGRPRIGRRPLIITAAVCMVLEMLVLLLAPIQWRPDPAAVLPGKPNLERHGRSNGERSG